MTRILGIDPGRNGALAVFDTTDLRVSTIDMPDTLDALQALLMAIPPVRMAVLERPFYPRHIGTSVVGKIAEAYGALKASLMWRSVPVYEVTPATWKRALNVPTDKSAARARAGQFFPADAEQWRLAKHDGRAEAALIAWYGRKFA